MTAVKSTKLKSIAGEARKLIEQQLDAADELVALREAATAEGFDWSQLKSLLTAQIKDERDDKSEGKRVRKLVERAEFACAYAGMLGLDERERETRSSEAQETDRRVSP